MTCAVHGASDAVGSDDKLPAIDIVYSRIEDIGKIFAVPDKAAALVANMKADIAAAQKKIKGRPAPRVFSGDDYNDANTPIADPSRPAMTSAAPRRGRFTEGSLWQGRSFLLYFAGYTVSAAGTAITRMVLPILVFQITGSALQTTTLLIVQLVPYIGLGLLAGALADRVNRRFLMIGADLVNAAVLATIPILSAVGGLTVPIIYLVALISATAYVFGNAAELGALPAIVGKDRLLAASSAATAAYETAFVVATALGGVLVTTIGAAPAIWVDVATYLVSALAVARIPRAFNTVTARPGADELREMRRRLLRDVGEGMRFVWRHKIIRTLVVIGFGNSFTAGAVLGLVVVYGVRQLGLPDDDARLGLLFSAGWAGALVGALILPRLARRVGATRLHLINLSLNAPLVVAVALSTEFLLSLAALFAWQVTWLMLIGNSRVLRQRLTPDRLQGRVGITVQMIAWGGQPFGAALGGAVADLVDVRIALLAGALGVAGSAVYAWCSSLRALTNTDVQRLVDAADQPDDSDAPVETAAPRAQQHVHAAHRRVT